ncbi:MAG: four helix bundle protein [Bacteroidales bacterium]|nr:four helix bundle protein [Bacteroidales bacterium]MBN2819289.1 four helix bundle protein [Bacteroidales bacterium]
MFDFEKLEVYKKAKLFNLNVYNFLESELLVSSNKKDQLERAAFSVMLNIAEGSGRFTNKDKRHFYVIARGSAFECVAIFDFLLAKKIINDKTYTEYYSSLEELSKMLLAMIKKLS